MSNDKVPASFHPDRGPTPPGGWVDEAIRVYAVYTVQVADGIEWVVCPICGPLDGAVLKGHGPNHIVPDASQ